MVEGNRRVALLVSWLCLLLLDTGLAQDFTKFAHDYAPYLRFDSKEGQNELCYPDDASVYYEQRLAGDWSRKCNLDFDSLVNGTVPTYWHAMTCGYHLHIAYWNFYGYNHDCDCCSGERDAWFEFIVIKIRDWDLSPHLHEVMFGQKKGWYTRIPGHYETYNTTHPVAYVGKANHGTYHDDGGTGTCCYYEDYRNPGSADHSLETWINLVELQQKDGEDWMSDPNSDVWSGLLPPTFRDDWDLCALTSCTGSTLQVCGACGCHKSDTGDSPF
ncbi:hypothetical protein OTU49_015327 [Cherax quadricarinatus]|uniref:Uncharacterized protein n=1 Tax=Cherax quadricarinatus TaxID=27406 RepID=A0AAW0YFM1_CHEQU|nr:uncharacterized protein LOC128685525 [Cherax quadricarinatus]